MKEPEGWKSRKGLQAHSHKRPETGHSPYLCAHPECDLWTLIFNLWTVNCFHSTQMCKLSSLQNFVFGRLGRCSSHHLSTFLLLSLSTKPSSFSFHRFFKKRKAGTLRTRYRLAVVRCWWRNLEGGGDLINGIQTKSPPLCSWTLVSGYTVFTNNH